MQDLRRSEYPASSPARQARAASDSYRKPARSPAQEMGLAQVSEEAAAAHRLSGGTRPGKQVEVARLGGGRRYGWVSEEAEGAAAKRSRRGGRRMVRWAPKNGTTGTGRTPTSGSTPLPVPEFPEFRCQSFRKPHRIHQGWQPPMIPPDLNVRRPYLSLSLHRSRKRNETVKQDRGAGATARSARQQRFNWNPSTCRPEADIEEFQDCAAPLFADGGRIRAPRIILAWRPAAPRGEPPGAPPQPGPDESGRAAPPTLPPSVPGMDGAQLFTRSALRGA
jgi:hypothetical protein